MTQDEEAADAGRADYFRRRPVGMSRPTKPKKPSLYQAKILRMIAASPLMKTYSPERKVVWGLQNGQEISEVCANALIRNGWVKPVRDGLVLFDESQTYVAQTP